MSGANKETRKAGMAYSEVKEKLTKFDSAKYNPAFRSSLISQVKLRDGDAAAKQIDRETAQHFKKDQIMNDLAKTGTVQIKNRKDSGNRRGSGIGPGNTCENDENFVKVKEGVYKRTFK